MVAVAGEVAVAGGVVLGCIALGDTVSGGTASGCMASGITALVAVGICRNSSGECCREKKAIISVAVLGAALNLEAAGFAVPSERSKPSSAREAWPTKR